MKRYFAAFSLAAMGIATATGCGGSGGEHNAKHSDLSGFYSPSSRWTKDSLTVCWTTGGFEQEKLWVKRKIQATWERHSALSFTGWTHCSAAYNPDISIGIHDDGAYTVGLGRNLKHSKPGMLLNFTFENWNSDCRSTRQECIETIAVHEFGHALGISHEHNRDDRDHDCHESPQGGAYDDTTHGRFDRKSIMNYCYDASYTNELSDGDIRLIQYMYGAP